MIESFVSNNDHAMKKEIKKRLIAMGATFDKETRNRKEDIIPVGGISETVVVDTVPVV